MVSVALCLIGLLAVSQYGECGTIAFTAPASGSAAATTTFTESTATGTTVETIAATTTEGAPGTAVTAFALKTYTAQFSIVAATGVLTNTVLLDYEYESVYNLIVTGADAAPVTATATLTLTLTAVATDPVFPSIASCVIMADLTASGSSVTSLVATDPDTTSLTYAITAGTNTNTDFTISSAGAVTTAKILYGTGTRSYSLEITAHDGTLTATTTLSVCVGSTTYCASCGSSGAISCKAFSIMTTLVALLAVLHFYATPAKCW